MPRQSQGRWFLEDGESEPDEATIAVSGCTAALPTPEVGQPLGRCSPQCYPWRRSTVASRGGRPWREQPNTLGAAVRGAAASVPCSRSRVNAQPSRYAASPSRWPQISNDVLKFFFLSAAFCFHRNNASLFNPKKLLFRYKRLHFSPTKQ